MEQINNMMWNLQPILDTVSKYWSQSNAMCNTNRMFPHSFKYSMEAW